MLSIIKSCSETIKKKVGWRMTIQRDRDVQWSKQIIQCCNNMLQPLSSISTHSVIHILIKLTSLLRLSFSAHSHFSPGPHSNSTATQFKKGSNMKIFIYNIFASIFHNGFIIIMFIFAFYFLSSLNFLHFIKRSHCMRNTFMHCSKIYQL